MASFEEIESSHLVPMYFKRGLTFVRGEASSLFDETGKRYLDFITHQGVAVLGYGNAGFADVIRDQAFRLQSCHNSFYSDARAEFLKTLHGVLPLELSRSILVNSGSEAVESALKLARRATGKPGVISTLSSYHGRTLGALSAMGTAKYREVFEPLLPHFQQVRFNDIEAIEGAINETTGAVLVEPIQGEAGVIIPSEDYLLRVRELCTRRGLLFIADEIQTGTRTGSWTCVETAGVVPDILCLAKGISNGFPIGVAVTTETVASFMQHGDHGSTFGGGPVAMTAGRFVIEEIERKNLLSNAREMGIILQTRLKEELEGLSSVREIRGVGLMLGIDLRVRSGEVAKKLQEAGLLVSPSGSTVLRMLPPLIISRTEVEEAVGILKRVLSNL